MTNTNRHGHCRLWANNSNNPRGPQLSGTITFNAREIQQLIDALHHDTYTFNGDQWFKLRIALWDDSNNDDVNTTMSGPITIDRPKPNDVYPPSVVNHPQPVESPYAGDDTTVDDPTPVDANNDIRCIPF